MSDDPIKRGDYVILNAECTADEDEPVHIGMVLDEPAGSELSARVHWCYKKESNWHAAHAHFGQRVCAPAPPLGPQSGVSDC